MACLTRCPMRRMLLTYLMVFLSLLALLLFVVLSNVQLHKYQASKEEVSLNLLSAVDFGNLHDLNLKIEKAQSHLKYLDAVQQKARESLQEIESRIDSSQEKFNKEGEQYRASKSALKDLHKKISVAKDKLREVSQALSYARSADVLSVAKPLELKQSSYEGILHRSDIGVERNSHDRTQNTYDNSLDLSLCSVSKGFNVQVVYGKRKDYSSVLKAMPFVNITEASCIYAAIIGEDAKKTSSEVIQKDLSHLPSWRGTGQNHLLIFPDNDDTNFACNILRLLDNRTAIAIGPLSDCHYFRHGFDIVMPATKSSLLSHGKRRQFARKSLVELEHKYFAVYLDHSDQSSYYSNILKQVSTEIITFNLCSNGNKSGCVKKQDSIDIVANSRFQIILNTRNITFSLFHEALFDALAVSTIPVILGSYHELPLVKFVDWKRLVISMPLARITETYYFMKMMQNDYLFQLRRQARLIMKLYFADISTYFETIFSYIRESIALLPSVVPDYKVLKTATYSKYDSSFSVAFNANLQMRNISRLTTEIYESWNQFPGPHRLIPCTPYGSKWPVLGHHHHLGLRYTRVSMSNSGGSVPFGRYLSGNQPEEQFTIVILAYDRAVVMMNSIAALNGVMHLHKVIVVWNNPVPPSSELNWPEIGVPIKVVFPPKNSLNNRFLPFDLIKTEAILSLDDDMFLRPADIDFAFRVWRQNRDQIVGFPGRGIDSNGAGNYTYNPTYSCQLSMILTGGAFFHKYYTYLYTYMLPSAVRELVDKQFNCEDIAMNFLVSYVTQKEPLKVTSRWTFTCPGCSHSLSRNTEHFAKRTACINEFTRIFGYLPLKATQFRADSVLFKTKLYNQGEKCYPSV